MTAVQLDLFAPAAPSHGDGRGETREQWAARFDRAWFTVRSTDTGQPVAGAGCLGWVCPCCGDVEPNGAVMDINHGYDPDIAGRGYTPFGRTCVAQMLRQAHAAYDQHAERAAAMCATAGHTDRPGRRHVNPGACDECWNATSTIAEGATA